MPLPEPTYTTWLELRDYCVARATISQERNDPETWAYWLDMAALAAHWAGAIKLYPPKQACNDYHATALYRAQSINNGLDPLSGRNIVDARAAARQYAFAKLCRTLAINQGQDVRALSLTWLRDAHQRLTDLLSENEAVRENATPPDRS